VRTAFFLTRDFLQLVRRHLRLLVVLSGREVTDRFAGSALGAVWALAHPLFLMGLFVCVFTFIFGLRFANANTGLNYSVFLISGYLPWMAFQDISVKSCAAITGNANLVKQVVFPLEVLPLKGVLASLVPQFIGLLFLMVYTALASGALPGTYLLLPVALTLQVVGLFGVAFLLAGLATFLRDLKEVMTLHAVAGLYLLPILFVPTSLPPFANRVLFFNPLSHPIWVFQDVLFYGELAHPWSWLITALGAFALFVVGYGLFRRVKVYFGNVL
jgi:lipopolysaccharide transport system permease protein